MDARGRHIIWKEIIPSVFGFEGTILSIILDSSMVEHSAVNRVVVGSSPTRGVRKARKHQCLRVFSWAKNVLVWDSVSDGFGMLVHKFLEIWYRVEL